MSQYTKNLLWGFIPSLLLPAITGLAFIHFRYFGDLSVLELVKELFKSRDLSGLLAISAFPNLLLFLYSMHRENWPMGRGVMAATMLYGLAVMIIKF